MNPILAYFDLNNRPNEDSLSVAEVKEKAQEVLISQAIPSTGEMSESISVETDISTEFFLAPPNSSMRNTRKNKSSYQNSASVNFPIWQQTTFYLGTVIGVLFSNAVTQFRVEKPVSLLLTWPIMGVAAVIGMVIMPYIHKHSIKRNSPFLIQFATFVQGGVFCMVILTALSKPLG